MALSVFRDGTARRKPTWLYIDSSQARNGRLCRVAVTAFLEFVPAITIRGWGLLRCVSGFTDIRNATSYVWQPTPCKRKVSHYAKRTATHPRSRRPSVFFTRRRLNSPRTTIEKRGDYSCANLEMGTVHTQEKPVADIGNRRHRLAAMLLLLHLILRRQLWGAVCKIIQYVHSTVGTNILWSTNSFYTYKTHFYQYRIYYLIIIKYII